MNSRFTPPRTSAGRRSVRSTEKPKSTAVSIRGRLCALEREPVGVEKRSQHHDDQAQSEASDTQGHRADADRTDLFLGDVVSICLSFEPIHQLRADDERVDAENHEQDGEDDHLDSEDPAEADVVKAGLDGVVALPAGDEVKPGNEDAD